MKIVTIIFVYLLTICMCSKDTNKEIVKDTKKAVKKSLNDLSNKIKRTVKKESEKEKKTINNKVENIYRTATSTISDISIEDLTVQQLWGKYKQTRIEADELKEKGHYEESIAKHLLGAKYAGKLERPDIASWQMNNAAKHCIDFYKDKTDYLPRMSKLNLIKNKEDKKEIKKETDAVLKKNLPILNQGLTYLLNAATLNEQKPDRKREKVISRNKQYIQEIKEYLEKER